MDRHSDRSYREADATAPTCIAPPGLWWRLAMSGAGAAFLLALGVGAVCLAQGRGEVALGCFVATIGALEFGHCCTQRVLSERYNTKGDDHG